MYPNRKVKLEDADITEETRKKFEEMCDRHPEAFSKNNKDIGRTTLIEMEIDMGDSLPVAQNPYTLPLKHHEHLPLSTKQMIQLQKNDTEARNIVDKLRREKSNAKMFILHDGVLCRLWTEERETFRCIFVSEVLKDPLLVLAHNQNGHNGG